MSPPVKSVCGSGSLRRVQGKHSDRTHEQSQDVENRWILDEIECCESLTGSVRIAPASRATWAIRCAEEGTRWVSECAYAYPNKRTAWKKNIQVVQTPAEPPKWGRMALAMIGWMRNSSSELRKIAAADTTSPGFRASLYEFRLCIWRSVTLGISEPTAWNLRRCGLLGFAALSRLRNSLGVMELHSHSKQPFLRRTLAAVAGWPKAPSAFTHVGTRLAVRRCRLARWNRRSPKWRETDCWDFS